MADPPLPPRRFLPEPLRKVALAAAVLAVCEIGGRIVAPGLNGQAIHDFLQAGGSSPLLRLYDWVVGGGLTRGGLLAIGIMPYLSARIIMRLARVTSPKLKSWWETESGIARRTRLTRWVTGGLALVQSIGFAKFVQNIPGAVEHPGIGFLARTMAVLTAGSIGVMLLSEALLKSPDDEGLIHDEHAPATAEKLSGEPVETASLDAAAPAALLSSGQVLDAPLYARPRETVDARPLANEGDRVHGKRSGW